MPFPFGNGGKISVISLRMQTDLHVKQQAWLHTQRRNLSYFTEADQWPLY